MFNPFAAVIQISREADHERVLVGGGMQWDEKTPLCEQSEFYRLAVTVKGARDLSRHDMLGKIDPVS